MSEAKKGKPLSQAQKDQLERLHKSNIGKKRTPEQIENITNAIRKSHDNKTQKTIETV